ncbi:septum formation initiator family protein [bacterium]|nr:septum formation initiator family protein [bacterium]
MPNEQAIPKKKRIRFSSEIMFIVSVVFCVCLSVIYLSRYNAVQNLLNKESELAKQIDELERENRKLKKDLQLLSTPEGIERLARERLGLVKPDEIVVIPISTPSNPAIFGEKR